MINDSPYISAPSDIPKWVAGCANLDAVNIDCICSNDAEKSILCYISTDEKNAHQVASAINGEVFGRSTVICSVIPSPEFSCKQRTQDLQVKHEECCCGLSYP